MKAKGLFMFKSVQQRGKGEFTNNETGEVVSYSACNVLVCDELLENGDIKERRFKFDLKNETLFDELSDLDSYTQIQLTFDITLYASNAKVTPISFEVA